MEEIIRKERDLYGYTTIVLEEKRVVIRKPNTNSANLLTAAPLFALFAGSRVGISEKEHIYYPSNKFRLFQLIFLLLVNECYSFPKIPRRYTCLRMPYM